MKTAEKRKQLFESLTPFLKPMGFKLYKTGMDPSYVYYDGNVAKYFFFNFKSYGKITYSKLGITHYTVEDYILALDYFPEHFNEKKKYHLHTVYDWVSKGLNNFDANTPEEIEKGIEQIKQYINGDGQVFLDTYMHVPNILKRMDELEAEGILWQDRSKDGILGGTLDAEFRGLIISKLCNDHHYEAKLAMTNDVFENPKYANWKPYYEKLKTVLPTIQPKYNLDI
jgi:hypothetical protein